MSESKENIKFTAILILCAAASVLIQILFLEETVQFFFSKIFGVQSAGISLHGFYLLAQFTFDSGISTIEKVLILGSPVLFDVLVIEVVLILINKMAMNNLRHVLFLVAVLLSGYLIVYVFYSGFSVILQFNSQNDWVRISEELFTERNSHIIFIIFVIIISAAYLNNVVKRILNYINR